MKMGSLFPDVRLSNPLTSTYQLPPGVRKDAADLPQYDGKMRKYRDALKERAEQDERRLFYVAITRARKRLYCTAAHWYASEDKPKGPSVFWDEVAAQSDIVEAIPGHLHAPAHDSNPVVESMRKRLVWPPQPFDDVARPWIEQIDAMLASRVAPGDILSAAGGNARRIYADHVRTIEALRAERAEEPPVASPRSLAATAAARIKSGDQSIDTVLHPLPQRPTDAQRLGTEVHAWIEELHRGLVGLAEEEALDEPSVEPDQKTVARLKANFAAMGFPSRRPLDLSPGEPATELPFTLKIGPGTIVRGRIDAVYVIDDARDGEPSLEIVDFKTGDVPDAPDWGQLELYADALAALGLAAGLVKLTYAYLRDGRPFSRDYTPGGLSDLADAILKT
jgi:DNA helicase-2/ATP-dependent DNA helicase PcrA